MDPQDLFAEFFGGSGMRFGFDFGPNMRPKRAKGEDSVIPYEVSLEDLYNGKSVKMNMEKEVVCGSCKGSVALAFSSKITSHMRWYEDQERKDLQSQSRASNAMAKVGPISKLRCAAYLIVHSQR